MSYLQSRIDLFKNNAFKYYLLSCLFAMFGNGLTYITLSWILSKSEHSVAAISGLMFCFWLPNILLSPFLGVIADRFNKKTILFACNFSRLFLLSFFYWLLSFHYLNAYIYLLALIIGCIISLYIPAAMAYVREIVDESELLNANATADMAYELGSVVGIGFSGLIIACFGEFSTLLINAFCYLISVLFILLIPKEATKEKKNQRNPYFKDLKEGFKYLAKQPDLMLLYLIQTLTFASYMTAPVLLVPFAKQVLHTSVGQFGQIEGLMSLGMVIGGLLTPYLAEKYGHLKVVSSEALIGAVCFFLFSHNHYISIALSLYFIVGITFSVWALITTLAQEKTDLNFQGRVQSLVNSLSGLIILGFYIVLSVLGESFPVAKLYWLEVYLLVFSACFVLLLLNRKSAKATCL